MTNNSNESLTLLFNEISSFCGEDKAKEFIDLVTNSFKFRHISLFLDKLVHTKCSTAFKNLHNNWPNLEYIDYNLFYTPVNSNSLLSYAKNSISLHEIRCPITGYWTFSNKISIKSGKYYTDLGSYVYNAFFKRFPNTYRYFNNSFIINLLKQHYLKNLNSNELIYLAGNCITITEVLSYWFQTSQCEELDEVKAMIESIIWINSLKEVSCRAIALDLIKEIIVPKTSFIFGRNNNMDSVH